MITPTAQQKKTIIFLLSITTPIWIIPVLVAIMFKHLGCEMYKAFHEIGESAYQDIFERKHK